MSQKRIKDIQSKQALQLIMGPLKGFTDHIYRNTFSDHFNGFDLAVAPFIASVAGRKIRKKFIIGLLPENNACMPVIPQILSKSAEDFIYLANFLYDIGYETVNWNLGCPFPMVTRKKRGSGLLPHKKMILEFLDRVIPRINGKLSIKTRLGLITRKEIFKLLPNLDPYPIDTIIIHPRTGQQRYEGGVDLEAFERCLSLTNHTIVYNGDIKCLEDFKALSLKFNHIHRWMIGRWSIVNPFLPSIIKSESTDIQNAVLRMKRFHDDLFDRYRTALSGPSHLLDRMKGFWRYFSLSFWNFARIHKKINKSKYPDHYKTIVDRFFESEPVIK